MSACSSEGGRDIPAEYHHPVVGPMCPDPGESVQNFSRIPHPASSVLYRSGRAERIPLNDDKVTRIDYAIRHRHAADNRRRITAQQLVG